MRTFKTQFTIALIFFIGFLNLQSIAQQKIQLIIENSKPELYYLNSIKGERIIGIDSAFCKNDTVIFKNKNCWPKGMYFIQNNYQGVIVLLNEGIVKLATVYPSIEDSLKIIESEENKIWNQYLLEKQSSFQNLDIINPIITLYDKNTKLYKIALNEFTKVQDDFFNYTQSIDNQSLAFQYIQADIKPKLPPLLSLEEQGVYFKNHWFDAVDWNNDELINSNILTTKITEYLGLYANNRMSKGQAQEEFKRATDQILPLTFDNPEMYAFIMDYLVRGFERYDMEEVILHIALNYIPPNEKCENDDLDTEALKRLKNYEKLSIGKLAPELKLVDLNGDSIYLSKTKSKRTLLIFWASWCPHCMQMIPELDKWNQQMDDKEWSMISISIDTNLEEILKVKNELNLHLPISCDLKGWDGKAVEDYNIYATPTMIVIDSDGKIIGKPSSIKQLQDY